MIMIETRGQGVADKKGQATQRLDGWKEETRESESERILLGADKGRGTPSRDMNRFGASCPHTGDNHEYECGGVSASTTADIRSAKGCDVHSPYLFLSRALVAIVTFNWDQSCTYTVSVHQEIHWIVPMSYGAANHLVRRGSVRAKLGPVKWDI